MSKDKNKYEQEAKAFFADSKNANVNTLYATSDGSLFRAEHYADSWKTQLQNKEVEIYHRNPTKTDITKDEDQSEIEKEEILPEGSDANIREGLVNQYIELFDTKPAYNIGLDKLQDKITEKKLELIKETQVIEGSSLTTEKD